MEVLINEVDERREITTFSASARHGGWNIAFAY
jgi:hypothetical protein